MGIGVIKNTMSNLEMVYMNINENIIEKENIDIDKVKKYVEYRIRNISRDKSVKCLEMVNNDKSEVEIIFSGLHLENIYRVKRIKLKGLDENANYINTETKEVFSGGALMKYGVNITMLCGDNYNRVNLRREEIVVES